MVVDERRRMALYDALRRTLDDDNADTLMGMLPSRSWDDVATTGDVQQVRDDVARLRGELAAIDSALRDDLVAQGSALRDEVLHVRDDVAAQGLALRGEMATQKAELRSEMSDLRTELRTGLAGVRTELADLRAEMHATMSANQLLLLFGLLGAVAANAGVVWGALSAVG